MAAIIQFLQAFVLVGVLRITQGKRLLHGEARAKKADAGDVSG